jgi:hypothetical protein
MFMPINPLVHVNDDIKVTLVDRCAQIIRAAGWPMYVTTVHLGVLYGQLCQAGYAADHASDIIYRQCVAWRDNAPDPAEIAALPHINNDNVLKLAAEAEKRIPATDQGGIIDVGCQLGQWVTAGASIDHAFSEVGAWMVKWYGGENPWQQTGPAPLPVGQMPWQGRLRIASGESMFVDDANTPQLPVLCHFMEAFSKWLRDPGFVVDQLQKIKEAGYDGIRFCDNLGYYGQAWRGKEVSPWDFTNREGQRVTATPDYYGQLRRFLMECRTIGLTLHHDRGDLGGSENIIPFAQIKAHVNKVAALYDELGWDLCALFAGNNEDWQNGNLGPARLRELVQVAKGKAITALSCPPDSSEDAPEVHEYSGDVFYTHGYRSGESTDRLRHIFSLAYEGYGYLKDHGKNPRRLGWQGEPTGPHEFPGLGVTVNYVNSVEELGLLGFQSLMCRQGWNFMSQWGVFNNGPIYRHSGFWVVPQMRALLKQFAPDVMSWNSLLHGGRGEAVLKSPTGYFGDPGVAEGPARIDQVISPNGRKCVATVHGGRGRKQVRFNMGGRMRVSILTPKKDNGQESVHVHVVELNDKDTLTLDYSVGRALFIERI